MIDGNLEDVSPGVFISEVAYINANGGNKTGQRLGLAQSY